MNLFTTNRLIVRKFEWADEEDFYQLNSHPDVMRFIRPAKTREECRLFLNENLQLYQAGSAIGRYHVAEKSSYRFAGTFSVLMMPDRDAFHIGYALMPDAQGKGLAKELLQAGLQWLAMNSERPEIFAITSTENIPSVALLQKAGFAQLEDITDHGKQLNVFMIPRSQISNQQASAC
ncbi:GNAT family N-acetyltransferase [Sediminibacterium goheungense]|uniref:RimJ/RimL family protein N-acetyltransferase n=1 Tax=Sediminibacterium goheungense TaxID=1086393 RepID=A0A4R6ITH4_9BACT|nr:GNAT family N-acetyltransferase [Sediminibacterium goheungense]TDO25832.1 RimJ/RimL family protein N-acetyltransferase [Sediminibacterium goheungense]